MTPKFLVTGACFIAISLGTSAFAQSNVAEIEALGAVEYRAACAVCHGIEGKGDGELLNDLALLPPDLTILSANNDGDFPWLKVTHIIDGRTGMRGHGSIMPIWGDRFSADVGDSAGPYGSELVVRGRLLSLVYYLEAMQL